MAIAKLRHPNIPVVFDHGDEDGQPCIVSEFLDGGSLADTILATPMTVAAAVALLRPIASALDYAHALGTSD